MAPDQLKDLLKKHMEGSLSAPEGLIFWTELDKPENEGAIKSAMLELSHESPDMELYTPGDWEGMVSSILNTRRSETPVRVLPQRRNWIPRVAAAAVVVLIATGAYFFFSSKSSRQIPQAPTTESAKTDIAPGTNKAILTLANGSKIILDSVHNGSLAKQGSTDVIKTDSGKLLYASNGSPLSQGRGVGGEGNPSYNTLTTPRGGIFQVTLPDGTQAWLNAASSITYPTRFTGNTRPVSITGEVYFEVAHDAAHPFVVETEKFLNVEVLGTHFNINAYTDDANPNEPVRTTLLEGSVKVTVDGGNKITDKITASKIIKPGEQASAIINQQTISVNNNIDLEKVMAWKNGEMILTHGDVHKLMQDISRWYDVDIEYQGTVPEGNFSGSVNRNVPLSSLLHVLKAYGIETELTRKKIIVK
jgi:transmembrane sensor